MSPACTCNVSVWLKLYLAIREGDQGRKKQGCSQAAERLENSDIDSINRNPGTLRDDMATGLSDSCAPTVSSCFPTADSSSSCSRAFLPCQRNKRGKKKGVETKRKHLWISTAPSNIFEAVHVECWGLEQQASKPPGAGVARYALGSQSNK